MPRSARYPPQGAVAGLAAASRAALARLRPRGWRAARMGGLVRRGHGDLHLGNIALIGGRPVPFDALEFDPLVASGDVLYDLAFLLMDLLERKLENCGNVVLNRYLAGNAAARRPRCAHRASVPDVDARGDPAAR